MRKKITITLLSVLMTIVCAVAVFSIYEGIANSRGPIAALKSYFTTEAEVKPPQDPTPGPVEDEPVVHEHEFGEWVLTTPATCTEEGLLTSTCSCGETQTCTVAALGHDFSGFLRCDRCGVGMVFTVDEEPNKAFYFDPDSIALIEFDTFEADDGVIELISENPTVYYFDTSNNGETTYIDIDGDHNADYYWENHQLFKAEFDGFKLMTHLEVYRFHNEHTFSEDVIVAREATLTEAGYTQKTCIHCSATVPYSTISPLLSGRVYIASEDEEDGMAVYAFITDNADGIRMYFGYAEIIRGHILVLLNDEEDYFFPCSSEGDKIYIDNNLDSYAWLDDDAGCLRFSNEEVTLPKLTGFDTISIG